MRRSITMKDIAEKLDVSTVTVSKALNDKEGVSDELKERIKQMADEMGYRINSLAKSMKEGLSYNIGVIIAERYTGYDSFYLRFYQQMTTVLEGHNYYGILHVLSAEDENGLKQPKVYMDRKVDGLIILGQVNKPYIELLQNIDIPIVFLDFYDEHENIDTITTDNFYSSYELTNYVIANGHKKIAFIGNIYATSSIQDRMLGYFRSLLEHKLQLRLDYIVTDRDDEGHFIDLELPGDMPTAFVCNCDQVAYNLIKLLKQKGYNVPEDISVVGFDNDIYSTISEPQITTVEVNIFEMSKMAYQVIAKKIKNPDRVYGRVLIKGRMIYRESVRAI
jgi:LacI family transcriptional regulator